MADQMNLEIVTPEKTVFSGLIEEVTIPGVEGEFGVLMGHESLLSAVKFGELNFTRENKKSYYAVNTGYAEVTAQKVTILVESCEKAEDIDVERAKRAKDKAEQNLSKLTKEDPDFDKMKDALQRAEVRIKVAQRS